MRQYLDLVHHIRKTGTIKNDRTSTGTQSIFGYQMRFDLSKGFPCITTKKLHLRSIIYELLWFLKGDTNVAYLNRQGVKIWNAWATKTGELGPIYGHQWRSWPTSNGQYIDQIKQLIKQIQTSPNSRRHIISAWNVANLPDENISPQENVHQGRMALAPCHCLFQFYVIENRLSCQLYQRSADVFLGVPFNIASYALLTMIIAQITNLEIGDFIHTFGDAHLYINHLEQADEQLKRQPRILPIMKINPEIKELSDFVYEDFELINYNPYPHIKAPISI